MKALVSVCEENEFGYKEWRLDGELHRDDGPAIEHPLYTWWWLNGRPHRAEGPAMEWNNGSKHWFLDGQEMSEEQWNERRQRYGTHERPINQS